MKLTPTQKMIVESRGKNILVSAGAGTGKTRVLVERFLGLVISQEALVSEILAITFTEKAAMEMKSRIMARLKELGMEQARRDLESAYISTFHALASRFLKEHPIEASVDPDFQVIEEEEAELLKEKALDKVMEEGALGHPEIFEFLRKYGESEIRLGVERVFRSARTEGRSLAAQIAANPLRENIRGWAVPIRDLCFKLGQKDLLEQFERFVAVENWTWDLIEDFKVWFKPFSLKKKDKDSWKELKSLCEDYCAFQIEKFGEGDRKIFEQLALQFEQLYENSKRAEGFLDFNDLEIKVLELFEKQRPANQKLRERYQKHFKFIMVDEFQDTSPVQARLVELISSYTNVFYVGDYKQSIYGFRGTSPRHFLDMERTYEQTESGIRVPLSENYRSEAKILDFINAFFQHLWSEDALLFEQLKPSIANSGGEKLPVELIVVENQEDENLAFSRMREAQRMASRILGLHENGLAFGDIVILFQAMTSSAIYEQALKRAGIPFFVASGRGFYHQLEIKDMLNFLEFLENPLLDIPLAALLRSPIFQVSDDAVFWLSQSAKQKKEDAPIYCALSEFEKNANLTEDDKIKIRFFDQITRKLQAEKNRLHIAELLDKILNETAYGVTVLNDSQGVRKYANLKKLVDLAREYESRERLSIADFIRTIRRLESREVRESEAQIEAEKSGKVVRLMTIHAAKGLEFPCVFIADLAYQKQSKDSKTFLAEAGLGYALQVINPLTREYEETYTWRKINDAIYRREREEWKRLFYVAMTRAKSRLILSGVHKPKKTEKDSFYAMSSWMDWMMASSEVLREKCAVEEVELNVAGRSVLAAIEKKVFKKIFEDFTPKPLDSLIQEDSVREAAKSLAGQVIHQLTPLERKVSRVIDMPVSAYAAFQKSREEYRNIYQIGYDRPEKIEDLSLESEETLISDADFGTLVHRALEYIDFCEPERHISKILDEIFRGIFEAKKEEARKILTGFFDSKNFKEIQKSKRLFKELPFIFDERHGRIHGVIDLLYEDSKGQWHVLDYKTATGDAQKVELSGYATQISIYAYAAFQILKVAPKTGTLYFLKNHYVHNHPFTTQTLEQFGAHLRAVQESMLDA